MSKYNLLWEYIKEQNREELILTYDKINEILKFDIDHSFLKYKKELNEYGYEVVKISLKEKQIKIKKKGEKS